MKKFVYELVTNRLGIVLAAINLCFFAKLLSKSINARENYFEIAMIVQNIPASLSAYIVSYVPLYIFPFLHQYKLLFIIPFIVFQWLFIAWLAKFIARKLRGTSNL